MRLFHVSEEAGILQFEPRTPQRTDLDQNTGLIWAIDEAHLPNFLTPRNCPRVTYQIGKDTNKRDRHKFFSSPTMTHAVVIESKWFETMQSTILYLYEFDCQDFLLQDEAAGYYVAKSTQIPKATYELHHLISELIKRNVEVRIVDHLWHLANDVKASTLEWSLCRMGFSQPET